MSRDAVCEAVECNEEGDGADYAAHDDAGDCLGGVVLLCRVDVVD